MGFGRGGRPSSVQDICPLDMLRQIYMFKPMILREVADTGWSRPIKWLVVQIPFHQIATFKGVHGTQNF